MLRRGASVALAVLVAACAAEAEPEPEADGGVSGRVAAAVGDFPSVVMLTPVGRPDAEAPAADTLVMDQLGMQFSPQRLLVPTGATVRFANSEVISHNVQLRLPGEEVPAFDEDADPGMAVEHTFTTAGPVGVTCSLHPGMTGFIFVHGASYATFAEMDGLFTLAGVPPGRYQLEVWSDDEELRVSRELDVAAAGTDVQFATGG